MNVESLLRSKGNGVATVAPGETIAEAAAMLAREKIGALVVSEDGQSVLGILSERDIAQGLAVHGGGLGDLAVRELMTRNVVTCAPKDEVTHFFYKGYDGYSTNTTLDTVMDDDTLIAHTWNGALVPSPTVARRG